MLLVNIWWKITSRIQNNKMKINLRKYFNGNVIVRHHSENLLTDRKFVLVLLKKVIFCYPLENDGNCDKTAHNYLKYNVYKGHGRPCILKTLSLLLSNIRK